MPPNSWLTKTFLSGGGVAALADLAVRDQVTADLVVAVAQLLERDVDRTRDVVARKLSGTSHVD